MILTIEEAKKKWCPKFQVSTSICGEYSNRDVQVNREMDSDYCKCIADECMAWRPIYKECINGTYCPVKEPKGYCGFAGKPEED